MRLLQKSLRTLMTYSLVLVIISVPISVFSIRAILNEEVDESLAMQSNQFLHHIKNFTYLDDLETDLNVLDQLSANTHIRPVGKKVEGMVYETVMRKEEGEDNDLAPYRQLSTGVNIKGKEYLLTIQMSLVDNNKLLFAIAIAQTFVIILLAAGLLLINRSLSKKLWGPFYETLNSLKNFQLDKSKSIEASATGIIEFDDLNKTVNHLTDRSRRLYIQQKEFIENASHELQTPLAIFQSKLDTLMQQSSMSEKEATTIMELEETVKRMSRLNRNLLLLSKIDNEQFTDSEEIKLSGMINEIISNLKTIAEGEKISITLQVEETFINANKALVEILINNLFHNAIRHTLPDGGISVSLKNKLLIVSNTGLPLRIDPARIFDRFTKESHKTESTGLGLAIVKRICDFSHYSLNYSYENDNHIFSVRFK